MAYKVTFTFTFFQKPTATLVRTVLERALDLLPIDNLGELAEQADYSAQVRQVGFMPFSFSIEKLKGTVG